MTNRACWLTVVTTAWAVWQGFGLLLAPDALWQSRSYEVIKWAPDWFHALTFFAVAGLGLAAVGAHHAGARSLAMHLTRGMAIVAGALATGWMIGFLAAWWLGSLHNFSAIGSWFFITGVLLEATGMGGRLSERRRR